MKPTFHRHTLLAAGLCAAAAVLPTLASAADDDAKKPDMSAALIAVVHPTAGNDVSGTVTFTSVGDNVVEVHAMITGLAPNSRHGFHIHQFGDVSGDDGKSAGGHFNPKGHDHALPDKSEMRHAGDLGNLTANAQGEASMTARFDTFTLTEGATAVVGRAVVVHAKADDGGQPTGNAGARVGVGVIGYGNPASMAKPATLTQRVTDGVKDAVDSVGDALEDTLDTTKEKLENAREKIEE